MTWMLLSFALAADPPSSTTPQAGPPPTDASSTDEHTDVAVDTTADRATSTLAPPSPQALEAAASLVEAGDPWQPGYDKLVELLGPPTRTVGETRCWLVSLEGDRCTWWHATQGVRADLEPGPDETPVFRFVGEGRAHLPAAEHPPCCRVE